MNEHEDLNWLAFRYVAGELDEAESQAFELQLETNQPAREAVAQAVMLTRCVTMVADECQSNHDASVSALATPVSVAGRGSAWGWVTALVVSAALLVLVSQVVRPGARELGTKAPAVDAAQEQLAEVWDSVREPLDEPAWTSDAWEEDDDTALELTTSVTETAVEDSDAYWIEAAVIGLSAAGSELGPIQ